MSTIEGEVVSVDLPFPTTDARKWASEFVRLHGGDEGLMLGWFANAMEHQRGPDAAGVTLAPDTDRLRAAVDVLLALEPFDYHAETGAWDELRAALAATPEPTPAPPALDVDVLARALRNTYHSVHSGATADDWRSDGEYVAAEYVRLATTTEPQAPPDSDQYDVVIPEPRP